MSVLLGLLLIWLILCGIVMNGLLAFWLWCYLIGLAVDRREEA